MTKKYESAAGRAELENRIPVEKISEDSETVLSILRKNYSTGQSFYPFRGHHLNEIVLSLEQNRNTNFPKYRRVLIELEGAGYIKRFESGHSSYCLTEKI